MLGVAVAGPTDGRAGFVAALRIGCRLAFPAPYAQLNEACRLRLTAEGSRVAVP